MLFIELNITRLVMTQNRWLSPSLIVIILLVVVGLLLQTQRLSDTSTELEDAQGEIVALLATATQASAQLSDEATQAAATQAALEASAATQQAEAIATQTAQAAAAATQQAEEVATQVAFTDALDESETNAEALAQDLATQAYVATEAAEAAQAQQVAMAATATLQAEAIETISQDYADIRATATLVAEQQATLAVDTMATMVALGYREEGSDVPIAAVPVEDVVYRETFDTNRGGRWYEGNFDQGGSVIVLNGSYTYTITDDDIALWTGDLLTTDENQLIEVRFRIQDCEGSFDSSGIEIGLFSERNSAYLFTAWCNHNSWALGRIVDGDNSTLGFGRFDTADFLLSEWHTLSVSISGDAMMLFIDGVRLFDTPLERSLRGTTFVQVFSEDDMTLEIDSIRVWNIVPTDTRNTNTLDPVAEPTPAPLTSNNERDLVAEVEAIFDAIPQRFNAGRDRWSVTEQYGAEYVQGVDGSSDYAIQSILLESEGGTSVLLFIGAFPSPEGAQDAIREAQDYISVPYDSEVLESFPSPNYFGMNIEDVIIGGWANDRLQIAFVFLSRSEEIPEQFQALGLWLQENALRLPKQS